MRAPRPAPSLASGRRPQGLRRAGERRAAPKRACRGRWCRGTNVGSALTASIGEVLSLAASGAVIRMARQNGRGPIKLFQKHDANHLVRPGRGAECDAQFRLTPQFRRKSVRAADHENSAADALIPPAPEIPGKYGAIDVLAVLVERHQQRFFRYGGGDRASFLGHSTCRVARAAFGNFVDLKAAEAELAADVVETLAIAIGQFPLRPLLQPADGNDDEAHNGTSGKAACAHAQLA